MKRTFCVAVSFLVVVCISTLNAQRLRYATGATYVISPQHHTRIFFELDERLKSCRLQLKPFTVSLLEDAHHPTQYLVSLNPVFGAVYGVTSLVSTDLGQVLLLPQLIGNFRFSFPISGDNYTFTLGQATDYFYLKSKPEVLSETTLGFKAYTGAVVLGVEGFYPIIHSAVKQRKITYAVVVAYHFH